MLRVLDLFSGIGGFSLGLERTGGFETVAFCEIEEFPRKVLKKHWPNVPCFNDVSDLKRSDIDGPIDVICGGYPCQPFSTAGKRQGAEDDRHLWPEVNRILDEFRPAWFIGENVAGHVSLGLDTVLSDLEVKGYACRPFIIPACAVDAKHRRDRVWIVANASRKRCGKKRQSVSGSTKRTSSASAESENVADTMRKRPQGRTRHRMEFEKQQITFGEGSFSNRRYWQWKPEPGVGRVANAISKGMDGDRVNGDKMDGSKTGAEVNAKLEKSKMPRMRVDGKLTEASSKLQRSRSFRDIVREMSRESGSEGWLSAEETTKILQDMREGIYPFSQQKTQYMQQGMFVGDWPQECREAMAWVPEPLDVSRVASKVPNRVDRLKALGNAVVPQIPEMIGYAILEAEKETP